LIQQVIEREFGVLYIAFWPHLLHTLGVSCPKRGFVADHLDAVGGRPGSPNLPGWRAQAEAAGWPAAVRDEASFRTVGLSGYTWAPL